MKKISLPQSEPRLDFEEALEIASAEAAQAYCMAYDSMEVIAWYDRRSRRSFPEVGFDEGQVVSWENTALSRGADVLVEMEGGRYLFLCGSSLKH